MSDPDPTVASVAQPARSPARAGIPRFALPEVVGTALSEEAIADIVQRSVDEMASGLGCSRLLALSYSPREKLLRGVTTSGFTDETIRGTREPVSAHPQIERALRTGEILVLADAQVALAPRFAQYFTGEVIVAPLILRDKPLAVLIGQPDPDERPKSTEWQARAAEVAARAALVVELERVSSAYQDELRLRQYNRAVSAAILEGRPLEEIADLVVGIVTQRLRVDRAALYLADESGHYRPAALHNVSAEYGENIATIRGVGPMMARAVATGLPVYVRNVSEDGRIGEELRRALAAEGIGSVLAAMLQQGEDLVGALVVYPHEAREFTPAELAVFQGFADQATLAVAMARLLEQQREIAVMRERHRLASEMHDTVAQSLTALSYETELAQTAFDSGDRGTVAEALSSVREQAKQALEDTRRAVRGLAPVALERMSPGQAIAEATAQFETDARVPAQFILTGEEQALEADQRAALLRIAQEALANARKHAQATRVRVGLNYGADTVSLIVEDDGAGFAAPTGGTGATEGGFGLFGMEERANAAGGQAQIESTPGWGTRVRVTLPYAPDKAVAAPVVRAPEPASPHAPPRLQERRAKRSRPAAPATAGQPRVLIVDDHAVTREGIRAILEASDQVTVAGEAADGADALEQFHALAPDVVLMDLQMPGVGGLEALKSLKADRADAAVVVLTTFPDESLVAESLAAGARGYVLKDAAPDDLLAAIHAAARGELLLSGPAAEQVTSLAAGKSGPAEDLGLSEREVEVLRLLSGGARNKEIAAQLFVSESTVEQRLTSIFEKLEVSNRTEAVRAAIQRGVIT